MRLFATLCAVALGCSSNSFDIAESPDAVTETGGVEDTNVASDTSVAGDTSVGPDSAPPPTDGNALDSLVLDAGAPDGTIGARCARSADCGDNQYCKYMDCATTGVCAALSPLPGPNFDPVCGCDGTTFWNKEQAYTMSAPIKHEGACLTAERKTCGTPGGMCDTPDSVCVYQLSGATACTASDVQGGCWRMPAGTVCGSTGGGPPMLTCTGSCVSQCNAVKLKSAKFYPAICTTTI